jgi:Arc/MetJ family transcription regulator
MRRMLTNIDIDEDLIAQAMKVSGARTKREAVDQALRVMIARANRTRVRDLWGIAAQADYWKGYDPKTLPEEAGRYRIEQGVATYKVSPPAQAGRAKPAKQQRKKR